MGSYGVSMLGKDFTDQVVLVVSVCLDNTVTADQLLVGLTEQVQFLFWVLGAVEDLLCWWNHFYCIAL